jgi:hypothetical protein
MLFTVLFLTCTSTSYTPKTVEGFDPYEVKVNKQEMVLVDMGYVKGTIKGRKIHAYRIAYHSGIGILNDHIYVVENHDQINITQPEGKSRKHISVIVENDTFRLEKQ